MSSEELSKLSKLSYNEQVQYLLDKYGKAKGDYFISKDCKTKNPIISRSKEGLFCHHVDEDKAIMLSNSDFARFNPLKYQKADRLVYCNILEHLLLHVKIAEEPRNKHANKYELPGIGGAVNFICKQINDYYNGVKTDKAWLNNALSLIDNNYNDYLKVLAKLSEIIDCNQAFKNNIQINDIYRGTDGKVVSKIKTDVRKLKAEKTIDK